LDQVRIDIITPTYSTVVPYGMTIMQRSSHETPDSFHSFDQYIFCTCEQRALFLLCKDPRTRQIRQVQSNYFHTSTNIIEHYFVHAAVSHYYCTVFLCSHSFAQYFYYATILARNRCIPPLIFYTMQRSSHETDPTSYLHVSVNITAQYFYYAKILTRNRFRTRQIHSTTHHLFNNNSKNNKRHYIHTLKTSLGKCYLSCYCDFDGGS